MPAIDIYEHDKRESVSVSRVWCVGNAIGRNDPVHSGPPHGATVARKRALLTCCRGQRTEPHFPKCCFCHRLWDVAFGLTPLGAYRCEAAAELSLGALKSALVHRRDAASSPHSRDPTLINMKSLHKHIISDAPCQSIPQASPSAGGNGRVHSDYRVTMTSKHSGVANKCSQYIWSSTPLASALM